MVTHWAGWGGWGGKHATSDCQQCFMLLFCQKELQATALTVFDNHSDSKHFPFSYAHTLMCAHTCWQVIISNHSQDKEQLVSQVINCWELFMSTAVIMQSDSWVTDPLVGFTGVTVDWVAVYHRNTSHIHAYFLTWCWLGCTQINILATHLGEWVVRRQE